MKGHTTPPITSDIEARFWPRVRKSADCWEWDVPMASGYGQFQIGRRPWPAHRIAYAIANGPIPPGPWILHRCNNKACVRPDHLYLGSPRDNSADHSLAAHPNLRQGWLCIGEASRLLGVSRDTLRQQVLRGKLAGRKYQEWFVTEREVERYRAESLGKPGRRAK